MKNKLILPIAIGAFLVLGVGAYFILNKSTPEGSGVLKIISPVPGDKWLIGKPYKIEWTGGGDNVSIFLSDKSLEPQGVSVAISWREYNIPNKGYYDFDTTNVLPGTYRFSINSETSSAQSSYFEIIPDPGAAPAAEPKPVIENITPNQGKVGTVIQINGKNLAGFEGDLGFWIENSKGEKGIIIAGQYYGIGEINIPISTSFKLPAKICTVDTSYSGLDCPAYVNIVPGVYKIYTEPWGNKSNVIQFTVIK